MSQIRVKDYTGKVIHKKKRGFTTKKEALEWERDFLNKATIRQPIWECCFRIS